MAELKLLKIRDIPDAAYIKRYEYGSFKVRVTINPDNTYFIEAKDNYETIEVTATQDDEPLLTTFMLALTYEQIDEFVTLMAEAKELMNILNINIEELVRKEN